MDEQARAIGARVRYWRERRKLDRRCFADMVGRSTSWLDKIEKGERGLLRLPMLERVADALGIDPTVLTDDQAAGRAAACVDSVEVQTLRAALAHYPCLTSQVGKPVALAPVARQLTYVTHAWLSSHFTVVASHLPDLIGETQILAQTTPAADQLAAQRLLVATYRLACSMLLKFGATDIAWLAADRAMHAASTVDDTLALAGATRSVARAMASSGQRADALAALTGMADRIRTELAGREHELLSLYGMLLLAGEITAALHEDHELALGMHHEAEAAADRLSPQHDTYQTIFGPGNVAVHRVAALVRLHEGRQALQYARTIDPALVAALPPERKANYLLDLAKAHTHTGQYQQAVQTLSQAEHVAAQEVHCRPLAHGLLRFLLNNTTGQSGQLVQQIAQRAGVSA